MVDPVTFGALIGLPISGGFVWLEIGRYATPQVPRTLFNERKEIWAYTLGLFIGVVLTFLFFLLVLSLRAGGFPGTVISLVSLVLVLEGVQVAMARSVYFGSDAAIPFYALGYRAGAGGLLGLGAIATVVANGIPSAEALGVTALEVLAFVLLLAAGGIQSTPRGPPTSRRPGAIAPAAILEGVGFFLLAFGTAIGPSGVGIAAVAIAGGSAGLYLRRRDILGDVRPPPGEAGTGAEPAAPAGPYGRTDR